MHLARTGVRLDLGAAAKGYAVDQAVQALRSGGVQSGLIEAGGDIRYWLRSRTAICGDSAYSIRAIPIAILKWKISALPLATSGDYRQYFSEEDGAIFILDPQSGWPARRLISATVWAETAMDADVLSTAVFVFGSRAGLGIDQSPRVEALVFTETGGFEAEATAGVQGPFALSIS